MKKFLLVLLLAGGPLLHAVVPAANLQVNLTSRDLQNTQGDAVGFNIPSWPVLVKSGGLMEFASGSTLKMDAGSIISGVTAAPGGGNGQIQYNSSGVLAGIPGLTWNGLNLTGLASPTGTNDAANKSYVDSVASGLTVRTATAVATTANITLSGEQTIDGVLTSGSRVLVKNQSSTQNNGIYTSASGAWSRASDSNTAATLGKGFYYFVAAGTTQGATSWLITTAPVTLNTDPVVFSQFSASQVYTAGAGLTLTGSSFSVNSIQTGITSIGVQTAPLDTGTFTGDKFLAFHSGNSKYGIGLQAAQMQIYAAGGGSNFIALGGMSASDGTTFTQWGRVDVTGFQGPIGQTVPAAGSFTTLASNSSANIRSSKGNFNVALNVKDYGATGNGIVLTGNISINSGSSTLTVSTAAFVAGDIGKTIVIPGAGTAGADLITTIAVYISGTQVTTAVAASANVIGVTEIVAYGTDDTAALNTALAAITNNSAVDFGSGVYLHSGLTFPASKTDVVLFGRGAMLYQTTNANNTLVVANTNSYITFDGLWFNGVGTSRQNGIHLRINSDYTTVRNCRIERSSDWGIQVDSSGSAVKGFTCVNNIFKDTCGDGVHVMNVDGYLIENNLFLQCGDDAIAALAQSTTIQPLNGVINGNYIYGRTATFSGTNTHGFRGIVAMIAKGLIIEGNHIFNTYAAGIEITDEYNSALYNEEVAVKDNLLFGCVVNAGPFASVNGYFCKRCSFTGNQITNPSTGSGFALLDCQQTTYGDNVVQQSQNQFCRGIYNNTTTPYIGRAQVASNDLVLTNNRFDLSQSSNNEAIYLVFTTGVRCNNLAVAGTYGRSTATAYITTDWIITGKFVNNLTIGGTASPSTGANSTGITNTNNL